MHIQPSRAEAARRSGRSRLALCAETRAGAAAAAPSSCLLYHSSTNTWRRLRRALGPPVLDDSAPFADTGGASESARSGDSGSIPCCSSCSQRLAKATCSRDRGSQPPPLTAPWPARKSARCTVPRCRSLFATRSRAGSRAKGSSTRCVTTWEGLQCTCPTPTPASPRPWSYSSLGLLLSHLLARFAKSI